MTSANLLARLRTLLDESSASFYTDTECYSALADGQRQIVGIGISMYDRARPKIPEVIRPLIKTATATLSAGVSTISLPADFLRLINLKYIHNATSGGRPCFVRAIDEQAGHREANQYNIADTAEEYYITVGASAINLETATVSPGGYYVLSYFYMPTDIASGQNPVIDSIAHNAIVQWALSFILRKDQKEQEAAQALNVFNAIMQEVMV